MCIFNCFVLITTSFRGDNRYCLSGKYQVHKPIKLLTNELHVKVITFARYYQILFIDQRVIPLQPYSFLFFIYEGKFCYYSLNGDVIRFFKCSILL